MVFNQKLCHFHRKTGSAIFIPLVWHQYCSLLVAKSLQSCPTLQPHRCQPTRLPHPWDSPGKNTGVGCHFFLQFVKVKSENEVAQLCPTLSDSMDRSLPGSSIHGIFQARVLEWGATASYISQRGNKLRHSLFESWLMVSLKDFHVSKRWIFVETVPQMTTTEDHSKQ